MLESLDPNWISAIANSIMALGVVLAWWQLKLNYIELRSDHARSRMEKAIELGANWVRNHDEKGADALSLVNALAVADAKRIRNREALSLDESLIPMISRVFPDATLHPVENRIHLTSQQSAELRWRITSYLNELEVVLSAWLNNVADPEMIEQEFSFVIDPTEGDYLAETFRHTDSINTYPAIEKFVEQYRKKNKKNDIQGKSPLPAK